MEVDVKFRVCKFSNGRKIVMIPKIVSDYFEVGEFVDIIKQSSPGAKK